MVTPGACRAPYPNDSELYNAIRERVKKEVFKGAEVKGAHRTGSEAAAFAILGYAATAYALYTWDANPITGVLLGECAEIVLGYSISSRVCKLACKLRTPRLCMIHQSRRVQFVRGLAVLMS